MDVVLINQGRWGALLALSLSWGGVLEAQASQETTEGRLITAFDFEERITADWSHLFLQEPSLPPRGLFFNVAGDPDRFLSGSMSLRFDLHGGSISYRTADHVVIPAQSNARYLIRAWVMTEGLQNAHARLEARVVDQSKFAAQDAEVIDPVLKSTVAEFTSDPVQTQGRWQLIELFLDTRSEAARTSGELRIVPALQVVQPGFLAGVDQNRLSPHIEDVQGTAWFDDLEVWRVPSVDLHTLSSRTGLPTQGVSVEGEKLTARIMIDDPVDPTPSVEITVLNLDGVPVHTDHFTSRSDGRAIDRDLPIARPGWYEIRMRALSNEEPIASLNDSLLVVPRQDHFQHSVTPRFGFFLQDWSVSELPRLASLLDVLDPGLLEFSMWPVRNDDLSVDEAQGPMGLLLKQQRAAGREVLLALDRVHPSIAKEVGTAPTEIAIVFESDPSIWMPEVERWLLTFGTMVDRWRIAGLADGSAIASLPKVLQDRVYKLVSTPALSVPCRLGDSARGRAPYFVAGSEVTAQAQADLLLEYAENADSQITVRLDPPPLEWARRDRVDEISRRIISAWKAGVERVLTSVPPLGSGFDETYLAWTRLGDALSGRTLEGELYVSDTATCLVANGESGLLVVAYSDRMVSSETITVPLGTTTVTVESIDGRQWSVANRLGVHEIEVSSTPVIIRDADSAVVSLASSMRFRPEKIESMRGPRPIELVVRNPFSHAIEGEIEFISPEGWAFEPARQRIRIEAESDVRVPSTIRWARIPQLGAESIQVHFTLNGHRQLDARVQVPVEIVSPGIEVSADWSLVESAVTGNESVLVTLEVTNRGSEAINLEAVAVAWRVGRERAPISNLQPGDSVIRRFKFNADYEKLAGTEVRLSLHEVEGAAALSIGVPISGHGLDTALAPEE